MAGPTAGQPTADVPIQWYKFQLKAIPKTPGFSPPVVARAFAYTGLGLYEAQLIKGGGYQSLSGSIDGYQRKIDLPGITATQTELIANAAMYVLTQELYSNMPPSMAAEAQALYMSLKTRHRSSFSQDEVQAFEKLGEQIAREIIQYSKSDGGHQGQFSNTKKDFKLPGGGCTWIPDGQQQLLQPLWGNNRFFIKELADMDVPPPPVCDASKTSVLYAQAFEVYSVRKNLTQEQELIANYWADDAGRTFTPAGHGMAIAVQLIEKENLSLPQAAELLCRMGLAASDAFVSCWKCKYKYQLLRPVSYISAVIDPTWRPLLATPPFPEYTSGHSSVSGAMSIVLADTFGYNYAFTDRSKVEAGFEPRTFESFAEYAQEAAVSRLYGGIHYRISNEEGLKNGKKIGKAVCALPMKKST